MKYEELKIVRTICGLTQQDMADLTGQVASNYSQKEAGNVAITLEEAFKIHNILNTILIKKKRKPVTMEELFKQNKL